MTLKTGLGVTQKSLKMIPFNLAPMTSY